MLSQLRFGNPLSSSYGLFGYASSSFTASYALPGATTSAKLTAETTYTAPLADFAGAPVVPRLGPVTDLQINGQSAYTTTAKVTTQPVLSWSPPQLGKASDYVVAIHQLSLRSGTTQTVQKLLAQIRTTETRIVVPPGLLTSGEYYVFRVTSNARSGYDLARPFRGSFPASSAATLSTLVTP